MRPIILKLLCVALCFSILPVCAMAAQEAADITEDTVITVTGYDSTAFLTDGNVDSYKKSNGDTVIRLENSDGMAGIYLMFDLEYGAYTITDNTSGQSVTAGQHGILHEYVDLTGAFGDEPTDITLTFGSGSVHLSELSVFSAGTLPEDVQIWHAPYEGGADLVLFAAHGDDDQLFFAGLLPLYAGEKDLRVQVVYLTDHRNLTKSRTHEMINGLWNVGVTAYPVFGAFADFRIDDLEDTYAEYENLGTSQEDLQSFVVEQIRRFKPQVAVGHDIQGEYGHGMHMVYADLLIKSLDMTNDAVVYPESAEKYGTWELPKLYLHLYEENPIVMDYDQPLENFEGMTAFEVTQKLGYPCHKSQQWTWFTDWINGDDNEITKATQIDTYSPCEFGLYHSTVGADVQKNDFMENVISYAEQERLEAERLEQERLEQERLEQERLEQERLEAERQEAEKEQQRLENEKLAAERKEKETEQKWIGLILLIALVVLLVIQATVLGIKPKAKKRRRRKINSKN